MCLVTNKYTPFLITILPKKVYKVVEIKDGKIYTPVQGYEIKEDALKATGDIDIVKGPLFKHIGAGMIHSYLNIEDAVGYIKISSVSLSLTRRCVLVYEAVIPPFTLYIKGKWGEIASRRLKLIKILK